MARAAKKNICVVTSTRADYGLLYWLMKAIESSKHLRLTLAVTGTHLEKQFGNTLKFIDKDGFKIDARININPHSKTDVGMIGGNAIQKFTRYFSALNPEAVIVLGDRFEILAIAQAAALCAIPLIHLHGGEISEGANDDMFRHAITKLSAYHFTSNNEHRKRVIQLGEQPDSVKVCGAMGIENIRKLKLLTRKELEQKYETTFKKNLFLITFHPATLEKESPERQMKNLIAALVQFKDTTLVFSKANADSGGDKINRMIELFSRENENVLYQPSFGQLNYLSLMKIADAVIGNSSSGIIEAPSLKTPTVDIGTRQKGRSCAKSVIHCKPEEKAISEAIRHALTLDKKDFFINPYDFGNASVKIVKTLERLCFEKLLPKKFYDLS